MIQAIRMLTHFGQAAQDPNANAETFSEGRLRESVRQRAGLPTAQLMNDVFAEIQEFADGRDFVDDVCLVGLEIAHLDATPVAAGRS